MAVVTKKRVWIAAIGILIVAALYPFESTVVPAWKIKVHDVNGTLCSNIPVRQSWGHYSLFISGNDQMVRTTTDKDGIVSFPERTVRAIGIRRLVMPVVTTFMIVFHGSTGARGTIHISGLKDSARFSYDGSEPLPDTAWVNECFVESPPNPDGALGSGNGGLGSGR